MVEKQLLAIDSKISREHIQCDGPGCDQWNPGKRCSRCRLRFYCTTACQKKDWTIAGDITKKKHKEDCLPMEEVKKTMALPLGALWHAAKDLIPVDELVCSAARIDTAEESSTISNSDCCICMKDPIEQNRVLVLKGCNHSFCAPCIMEWQTEKEFQKVLLEGEVMRILTPEEQSIACPLCRNGAELAVNTIVIKAGKYQARAYQPGCDEKNRHHYLELAIQELSKALIDDDGTSSMPDLMIFLMKAELLLDPTVGRGQEALDCLDEMERINTAREKKIGPEIYKAMADSEAGVPGAALRLGQLGLHAFQQQRHKSKGERIQPALAMNSRVKAGIMSHRGAAYKCMEDFSNASKCYTFCVSLIDTKPEMTPQQKRGIWKGVAECALHLKDFEGCIAASDSSLKYDRHFKELSGYKALSQKATGKIEDAIQTMELAAIYETPWDEINRQRVIDLYNQLIIDSKGDGV